MVFHAIEIAQAIAMNETRQPETATPAGWDRHELTKFFSDTQNNRFATYANQREQAQKLIDIDDVFWLFVKNSKHGKSWVQANLALRSFTSFRAASGLVMAGQLTETYPLIRSTLEFSAYALRMQHHPELTKVWFDRGQSDDARRKVRKAFHNDRLKEDLALASRELFERWDRVNDIAMNFGAHPNEMAITSNVTSLSGDEATSAILHGDGILKRHTLVMVARAGVISLEIFQKISPERFILLGLESRMRRLMQGL